MTSKELRAKIDVLVGEMGVRQTEINELAAKLIIVTKEEMKREALRVKTDQGHS